MNDIVIDHLTKRYGKDPQKPAIVNNISLSIKKGSVFGFIGPNGAGKTSTIKMLVGLTHPTSGHISVLGGSPHEAHIKKEIGFMPESPSFYHYLTGYEFLDLVATLFSIPHKEEAIGHVLEQVDLTHAGNKKIRTYSKGMQQRLGLAQAIINEPRALFLDEPLDGLDPLGRADVKKIIRALKKKGMTIFISTHILGDVEDVCDEVSIIDKGEILITGSPRDIIGNHATLEEAFVHRITKKRELSS